MRVNVKSFLARGSNWLRRELSRPQPFTLPSLGGSAAQTLSRLRTAVLFALLVGFALLVLVPEAGPLLAAVDAIGLEAFALFIAFELRHYLAIIYRIGAAAVLRGACRWSPRPIFGPYAELLRAFPARSPALAFQPLLFCALASIWLIALVRRGFGFAGGQWQGAAG